MQGIGSTGAAVAVRLRLAEQRLAVEVEGGIHRRPPRQGTGYEQDISKYNAATLMGWTLLLRVWSATAKHQDDSTGARGQFMISHRLFQSSREKANEGDDQMFRRLRQTSESRPTAT